jgi:hypothetical protein
MGKIYDKASIIVPQGSAYEAAYVWATKPLTDDGKQNYIRSGSATRITDCGEVKEVGSNIPQYDYIDGLPWVKLEKQSTNLITNSVSLNSSFTNAGTTASQGSAPSPEGKINAVTIGCSDTVAHYYTIVGTSNAGTRHVFSCWYKGTAGETVRMRALNSGTGALDAEKLITFTGEWQREYISFVPGTTYSYAYIVDRRTGVGTATSFQAYGAQIEFGYVPSSFIKTTGSAVTRPQNFYNADAFKSGYEFTPAGWSYATKIKWGGEFGNGGNVKRFATSNYSSVWYLLEPYNNGTAYISLGPAGSALLSGVNLDKFIVYRYNGTVLSVYNNGNLIGSGTVAMGGNFTQKDRYGDSGFIGHIGDELYFNQCLSAEEAIQLSLQ